MALQVCKRCKGVPVAAAATAAATPHPCDPSTHRATSTLQGIVLVTGASGYAAQFVVEDLAAAGRKVGGVLRELPCGSLPQHMSAAVVSSPCLCCIDSSLSAHATRLRCRWAAPTAPAQHPPFPATSPSSGWTLPAERACRRALTRWAPWQRECPCGCAATRVCTAGRADLALGCAGEQCLQAGGAVPPTRPRCCSASQSRKLRCRGRACCMRGESRGQRSGECADPAARRAAAPPPAARQVRCGRVAAGVEDWRRPCIARPMLGPASRCASADVPHPHRCSEPLLVHISTDHVYDGGSGWYTEEAELRPVNTCAERAAARAPGPAACAPWGAACAAAWPRHLTSAYGREAR